VSSNSRIDASFHSCNNIQTSLINNGFFGNAARFLGGEFIDTSELKDWKKTGYQMAKIFKYTAREVMC